MAGSKSVVIAALIANGAIAVLKFLGFLVTGSPAMLSEVYHSISDTGNQVFLLIGLRYGEREATRSHPFGYGKAQFFYSFLVSVMLFGIAGWESAKHGYNALTHHGGAVTTTVSRFGFTFPGVWVNYAVLLSAVAFESYAFTKAYKEMQSQIKENDWSGLREAFRRTSDTTTLTALTEDTVALAGLVLALVGIFLTQQTGNPVYDAAAALLIGLLLMVFAVALALENKRLLLGESISKTDENQLREVVRNWEGVDSLVEFRSVYFGPRQVLVTADVEFEQDLETEELEGKIADIVAALKETNSDVKKAYVEPQNGPAGDGESSASGSGGPSPSGGDGPPSGGGA
ncbi:cation diffusion facilitator family transporter [Halobacterium zhouii]|uniref:cation diffusion facilitator family transporter n=1 Tax=Halobacterium zhouii TaxID=2902624 RepID=UPI001E587BBB|nr:cation diffusion facilitator family transporter [Halobacterium zhouii]